MSKLRLGTRGSRLALAQAHSVQEMLQARHPGLDVEIVVVKTSGDRGQRERLGAFVREIQEALLANEVDVALHCLKDLPTEPVGGLRLAAHLHREDPADAFISAGLRLSELPEGSVVGTGSVRRTSQLAIARPDLRFKPLVGNVDTRMRKLSEGEYDAIILAIAGLKRLGVLENWGASEYHHLVVRPLDPSVMLPAPGQAVLVLESRESEGDLVEFLNDPVTQSCATAERAFLRTFGGGCSVPVAALASAVGPSMTLRGLVASPDGKTVYRGEASGSDPLALGQGLGTQLGEQGAFDTVRSVIAARTGESR